MKWLELPFKKVAEVVTGNTPPRSETESYSYIGIPWVKPPDLNSDFPITETSEYLSNTGKLKARVLPKDSVMVCCIGTIGKVGIAGCEVATNQQINSLIFNKMVEPRYGYYYCRANSFRFQAMAPKAVVPIIKKSIFENINISVPPISEQRRIVEILDQADEIRKLRKQADEKAEKIIPASFYEIFGDVITNNRNWKIYRLSEIAEVKRGDFRHRPRSEKRFYDGPYPFIQINDITSSNYFIEKHTQTLNEEGLKISRMFRSGTLVISIAATIASAAILKFDSCFPDSLVGINGNSELITQEFLLLFLRTLSSKLNSEAPQLAQKNINLKILNNLNVPVPPLEIQKNFSAKFCNLVDIENKRVKALQSINLLFETLLSKAFDGSLTASWRASHMKELFQEMEEQKKYLEKIS